jgi:nucleoside-diphosphate kinase
MKYTLTIIKPDAVAAGYFPEILHRIQKDGKFRIAAMKMTALRKRQVENFYKMHKDKEFFQSLVDFMSSGPVVLAVLEKRNAVDDYRKFIGKTNPAEAEKNSIRNLFGTNIQNNAVHGSDSDESAIREIHFFFGANEIFDKQGNVIELHK